MAEKSFNEEWKPVPAWNGRYWVSNLGRIKNGSGKILRPGQNRKSGGGYLYLCAQDRRKGFERRENLYLHRLVAELWVPNPLNKPCVNHLDEDISNNRFDNLAWCTAKENVNYGSHNAKVSAAKTGMKCPWRNRAVLQFDARGVFIKKWKSIREAAFAIKSPDAFFENRISSCCRGTLKTAGGYVWRYA